MKAIDFLLWTSYSLEKKVKIFRLKEQNNIKRKKKNAK